MAVITNTASRQPAARLHYIYDPLCGWCYAAEPLIEAAASIPGLVVELHGGGMLTGARRQTITPRWREYVLPHDRRIAESSGQPFGAAYFDVLLHDGTAVLDSEPPITAVLAAQSLSDDSAGLDMLRRLQRAHYFEGRRIADSAVLSQLANEAGLEAEAFRTAFERLRGAATQAHIDSSRRLLAELGGRGFPTVALSCAGEPPRLLDFGHYLGQAEAWRAHLSQRLAAIRTMAVAAVPAAPQCAIDSGKCDMKEAP